MHVDTSRNREIVFVVAIRFIFAKVRSHKDEMLAPPYNLPTRRERKSLARITRRDLEPQDFLDMLELQRNSSMVSNRPNHSPLYGHRLTKKPYPAQRCVHH